MTYFRDLLKLFTTSEIMRWKELGDKYEQELRVNSPGNLVFNAKTEDGTKRWKDLKARVVEHVSQWRRFALRFIHSHSGAIGVFWLKCRVVYFRYGAKMTDASSKIDVRRLKVGDLLIKIFNCGLLGLVFLVLGRS